MRWMGRILAAIVVLAAGMGNAQPTPKRLALIIGNADYNLDGRVETTEAAENSARRTGHAPDLKNTLNDARDIREALARLQFDVSSYKENATGLDMITLLDAFGKKIDAAGPDAVVLVYYSGHGMQIEGENFLVPAGAQLQGADYESMSARSMQTLLERVATPMKSLKGQMRARTGNGVNVIILDACRNNPWSLAQRGTGGGGFADEKWGMSQTMLVFSTEPGATAYDGGEADRNSPYTAALKMTIGTPNLDILNMFNTVSRTVEAQTRNFRDGAQRPWSNQTALPTVCLGGCSPDAGVTTLEARLKLAEIDTQIQLARLAKYYQDKQSAISRTQTTIESYGAFASNSEFSSFKQEAVAGRVDASILLAEIHRTPPTNDVDALTALFPLIDPAVDAFPRVAEARADIVATASKLGATRLAEATPDSIATASFYFYVALDAARAAKRLIPSTDISEPHLNIGRAHMARAGRQGPDIPGGCAAESGLDLSLLQQALVSFQQARGSTTSAAAAAKASLWSGCARLAIGDPSGAANDFSDARSLGLATDALSTRH